MVGGHQEILVRVMANGAAFSRKMKLLVTGLPGVPPQVVVNRKCVHAVADTVIQEVSSTGAARPAFSEVTNSPAHEVPAGALIWNPEFSGLNAPLVIEKAFATSCR